MVTARQVASLVNFGQMHAQTMLNKRPDVIRPPLLCGQLSLWGLFATLELLFWTG
jgi:hypothetical protein